MHAAISYRQVSKQNSHMQLIFVFEKDFIPANIICRIRLVPVSRRITNLESHSLLSRTGAACSLHQPLPCRKSACLSEMSHTYAVH